MGKISVLLVDDHPVVREGLRALLVSEPDIVVTGESADGREAIDIVRKLHPDVVVMDLALPGMNGIEATRHISRLSPAPRVLVLSTYSHDEFVAKAIDAGTSGYVLKQTATEDLIAAIRAVHSGREFFSPPLARRLQRRAEHAPKHAEPGAKWSSLTGREAEVLQLIADGFSNKEIAAELGISVKTVEKHRQQVMNKLGIHETAGLTRYALGRAQQFAPEKLPSET